MDKLLVIGASGLLGGRAAELAKGRYQVFGTYKEHKLDGQDVFPLDVTKRNEVFALIEKIKPDFVIDTHALHNVDYCETHPEEAWLVNVEATKNVAEACKRVGAKYIFVSTDYIFDGKKMKYTEKDKPNPLNYYAKTKWAAELMLEALDINYIIVRPAILYGSSGMGKLNFVLWVIQELKGGKNINVVTDQHNNPTLADNLAAIMFRLYELDAKGTFNATGKDCLSRFDFAKLIAKTFNLNGKLIKPITTPELKQIAKRPERVSISTNKVERVTGMRLFGAEEGLKVLKAQMVKQ